MEKNNEPFSNYGAIEPEYSSYETSKFVIVPVPYDKTSTWLKGADKGPDALIEASGNMELYDIETDSEVYKKGIFTDNPIANANDLPPEQLVEEIKKRTLSHLNNNKLPILIGGEHTICIGAVHAFKEKYKDISVLQLDAHADLRDIYENDKFNHACVMARIKEQCPIVQVGIRSMDSSEKPNMDKNRVFFAKDIHNNSEWMDQAISLLSNQVYITIDLDAFDPSILPSTGTPEPGGIKWYETLKFLRKVIQNKEVVGFDVVELCPNKVDKSSDFLATKLVYKLMSYIVAKEEGKRL